jgi:hypothetical protein
MNMDEAWFKQADARLRGAWADALASHSIVATSVPDSFALARYAGPYSVERAAWDPVAVDAYAVGRLVEDLVGWVAELRRAGVKRLSVAEGYPRVLASTDGHPRKLIWMLRELIDWEGVPVRTEWMPRAGAVGAGTRIG